MKKMMAIGVAFGLGTAHAATFPASNDNSALYYQIGGGQSVPMPPVTNRATVPISVSGNLGLGFSCGLFSPVHTITNSLNNFRNSIQNVSGSIVANATSAIISFPMYKLAEADPKLYNILNNNVIGAHSQFALNMKSCHVMQSEALRGGNPYRNWITVSRDGNMMRRMHSGDDDLNRAMDDVNQTEGDHGVPWATPGAPSGRYAGGIGQPPIRVVRDTAVAGYNVMLGRDPTDSSPPARADSNRNLLKYWGSPGDAARWIVGVVGDQKVTTCARPGCGRDSVPGRGLLPYIEDAARVIRTKLADLISNPSGVNADSLMAVSAPGQMVSPALLENIRFMNRNAMANTIATLAQNIATTRVVNEAMLAIDLLDEGSRVPSIHAVGMARRVVSESIRRIEGEINRIARSITIRRELDSGVMDRIMRHDRARNMGAASIPRLGDRPMRMEDGAVIRRGTGS